VPVQAPNRAALDPAAAALPRPLAGTTSESGLAAVDQALEVRRRRGSERFQPKAFGYRFAFWSRTPNLQVRKRSPSGVTDRRDDQVHGLPSQPTL
jgi:hypothetical protein